MIITTTALPRFERAVPRGWVIRVLRKPFELLELEALLHRFLGSPPRQAALLHPPPGRFNDPDEPCPANPKPAAPVN